MRKLIVHEFITLDGVIQAPGGQVLLACAEENVERLGSKGLRRIGAVG